MQNYTAILRRKIAEEATGSDPIIQPLDSRSWITAPGDDDYSKLAHGALARICGPGYPAGMLSWLESSHPELYQRIAVLFPQLISELWTQRASLGTFSRTLDDWVDLHRRASDLCIAARDSPTR
jgi:hypothetical protein